MNLVIDRGNTQMKLGIFDQCQLAYSDSTVFLDKSWLSRISEKFAISKIILSTVVSERHDELLQNLKQLSAHIIELNHQTPLPFKWHYKTKDTIGKDRLAAVAGAISLYPESPLLVIDAGTAITYELVNNESEYVGGNIAPGMQMRYRSLHDFTSRLPQCEPDDRSPLIGNSTHTAIQAGVQNGISYEIDGLIHTLSEEYPKLKTIITGGDAEFFARKLKNPIFVHSNLVLIGLNRILEYNARNI